MTGLKRDMLLILEKFEKYCRHSKKRQLYKDALHILKTGIYDFSIYF